MNYPLRRYQLEVECTITHCTVTEQVNFYRDYPLYFSILIRAVHKQEAIDKARAVIKKYYPNATYIAFTTIDPPV